MRQKLQQKESTEFRKTFNVFICHNNIRSRGDNKNDRGTRTAPERLEMKGEGRRGRRGWREYSSMRGDGRVPAVGRKKICGKKTINSTILIRQKIINNDLVW